jgi:hypothetical protein
MGVLALCFSYVPFMGSSGLEFWLLNAVLIQAASVAAVSNGVERAASTQ